MNDKRRHSDPELGGSGSDDMLRRRFAALRQEEDQQAPVFATLWRSRAGARRRQTRWFAAAACAMIALLAFLWIRSVQRRPDDKTVASITEWKAPTDFLLETPGRELLRTVPEIGEWQVYTTMPGATPSSRGKKGLAVKED
jgi:hypothetical protein